MKQPLNYSRCLDFLTKCSWIVMYLLAMNLSVQAQRDTLQQIRFPYTVGYHQTFTGLRLRPIDTSFVPVPIHFYQEIIADTISGNSRWFQFNTYSEIGPLPQKGLYYLGLSKVGEYRWYAGAEWNFLIIPAQLYKGLWWKTKQAGQKYRHEVVKTDTLISTPFGSHRCFVIKSEVRNLYFEGKKHRTSTWDFYDPTLGKVKSVTIAWKGRGGLQVYREQIELSEFGIGK